MKINQKVNILLVDDRTENLLALEAVLKSPRYNLVKATSGEEALRSVLKSSFSLILLDVQMPGMNGFETAKLIKSRQKTKNIPIIFVTAINQAAEHVAQGYKVGAIDYIFKPFLPETLQSKVEGFVNLYLHQEKIRKQQELLESHTKELEKTNQKLQHLTKELKKSEALARIIGETSKDAIFTLNSMGKIIYLNPIAITMFGFLEKELLGQEITILINDYNESTINFNVGLDDKKEEIFEAKAVCKNKKTFPIEVQLGHTVLDGEKLIVCTIRDITERKQQYEVLEKLVKERTRDVFLSQERFRKIFQTSPCLVSIRSLKDGKYIDVNKYWLNSTGYSESDLKDGQPATLYYSIGAEEKNEMPFSLDLEVGIKNAKVVYKTKNGKKRQGLLSTEIFDLLNEKCILGVVTDITERVSLEIQLARLDRLNLIGEMAAGIAHEIRNPMTSVKGFLQMAKNNNSFLTDGHIDLMVEELNRANTIITEFLSLAKNKKTDRAQKSLNKIIMVLKPLIEAEALLKEIDVNLELDNCHKIFIDEKEIRQMILNLSINGIEAMKPGGVLTIRTIAQTENVILEIEDQGSGIEEKYLEKIGTPFFTTKDNGTGLGLAVCYSIAERHQASININSHKEGTKFSVRFSSKT